MRGIIPYGTGFGTTVTREVEKDGTALARVADLEAELKQAADTRCLIWSHEHSAWWGPCSQGYTTNLTFAGIYSREEAIEIVNRATLDWTKAPNEVVVRLADVPVAAWGVPADLNALGKRGEHQT